VAVLEISVLAILEIDVLVILEIGVLAVLYIVDRHGVIWLLARPLEGAEQCRLHLL
jgi:hypothetical protein